MAARERGKAGTGILATLLVLALGATVVYLASEINQRRYRLVVMEKNLVVERGRRMPIGFAPYNPDPAPLKAAYAPVPIAADVSLDPDEVYDDRTDLDRALFALLSGWAHEGVGKDGEALERALTYADRAALLPGLSEEQRKELQGLRAELAYGHARQLMQHAIGELEEAKGELEVAQKLGSRRGQDAAQWLNALEQRLITLRPLADPRGPENPPGSTASAAPEKAPETQDDRP